MKKILSIQGGAIGAMWLGLEEKAARKKINVKPLQEIFKNVASPSPIAPIAPLCTHNDFL